MDCSLPGSSVHPWDFPGKSTGVGCHFLLHVVKYHLSMQKMQEMRVRFLIQEDPLEEGSFLVVSSELTGLITTLSLLKGLSTTNRHFSSTSSRIKSCATGAADFQHPLKRAESGEQK